MLFECKIDETQQGQDLDEREYVPVPSFGAAVSAGFGQAYADGVLSLARAVIDARETLPKGIYNVCVKREWSQRLSFLAYACEHPSRRKRTHMDVEKMVNDWLPLIVQLATAHDIDESDQASARLDEMLLPVIAAPVSEIREFYQKLVTTMKADPRVPWSIWRLFEFWGTNVLDKIDKEETIGLKTELAKKIAEHSFEQIPRSDWIDSMVGALQWRHPEKLKEVETALEKGHKPRVKGRESCLFLEVDQVQVML